MLEPALYEEARAVLAGEPARLKSYGIADEEAFEAGLPCGGTVHVFIAQAERELVAQAVIKPDGRTEPALEGDVFFLPLLPRPRMYVFGALDHAAAAARVGSLLGFHITVCDARSKFLTRERFPEADELIMGWPDEFLRSAPIDSRTAICVLTHDHKFDVPVLQVGQRCRLRRGARCQEDQRGAGRAAAGGGNHR